jgi:hypothetical protein
MIKIEVYVIVNVVTDESHLREKKISEQRWDDHDREWRGRNDRRANVSS